MNCGTTMKQTGAGAVENRAVREARPEERRYQQPQVAIVETPDRYVLEAEMPGVNKNGLEVLLEGNELTLVGRRAQAGDLGSLLYRESYDHDFRRVFELDPAIDTSKIAARIEDGLLVLELPKAERVKPRKISIN